MTVSNAQYEKRIMQGQCKNWIWHIARLATARRSSPAYVPPAKRQSVEPAVVIAPRPVSPRKDGPPAKAQDTRRCYNCDKEGHFATECPEKKKEAVRRVWNEGDEADEADEIEEKGYSDVREAEGYSESEN